MTETGESWPGCRQAHCLQSATKSAGLFAPDGHRGLLNGRRQPGSRGDHAFGHDPSPPIDALSRASIASQQGIRSNAIGVPCAGLYHGQESDD